MSLLDTLEIAKKRIVLTPDDYSFVSDYFELCRALEPEHHKIAHESNKDIRRVANIQARTNERYNDKYYELYKKTLLFDAREDLDAYMQYIEFDRDPDKRFYLPRRKHIAPIVKALQQIQDDELDLLAISQPPGTGKAQPLYSKVLTPKGFVEMGSISVGDTVIAGNGEYSKVIGVYPQGIKGIYRVNFRDGTSTECCKEHLWLAQSRDDRCKTEYRNNTRHRIFTLEEMMKNLTVENGKRLNYSIDSINPVEMEEKPVLLDPYIMGVILGDGSIKGKLSITSNDDELVEYVKMALPKSDTICEKQKYEYKIRKLDKSIRDKRGWMVKSDTQTALEYYGLFGKGSDDKFIPKDYLVNSVNVRLEVLRGLLDTDGYAGISAVDYVTVSEKLKDGIVDIVRSLGGYATVSEKIGTYRKDGVVVNCKKVYRVVIIFNSSIMPFKLSRKVKNFNMKRKEIKKFISSVDYVGEKECQCIMIDNPCHLYITDDYIQTHNTTIGIIFLTWQIGLYPNMPNLASAHSDKLTRSFYDGAYSFTTDPEYLWSDVFPNVKLIQTNAKDETLDFDKHKRFKSLTCRSIDGSLTGATRCERILYADDLVSGIEEALSKDRMDTLWGKYTNDLKSRKKLGCKEIHIATRWSIHDPIGRLERQYADDDRAKFLSMPALNEDGESNFDYHGGVGFDTKYFMDMKDSLDDVSWRCLYQNEPIEREGLLYVEDELRTYYELPDKEPDVILGICDTAEGGKDDTFLPVGYMYGNDVYIEGCVCSNAKPEVTDALCADILLKHKVKSCQFESNSAGGRTADNVQKRVKDGGGITHITKKRTTANKETKIIVNSSYIKQNFLFKDKSVIGNDKEYKKMMNLLCSYTMMGKNKNDDVPDGLAQFAEYIQSLKSNTIEVFKRPF